MLSQYVLIKLWQKSARNSVYLLLLVVERERVSYSNDNSTLSDQMRSEAL